MAIDQTIEQDDPVFRDHMEASSPTFAALLQRRCITLIADMVEADPRSIEYRIASDSFWHCFSRLNVLFGLGREAQYDG